MYPATALLPFFPSPAGSMEGYKAGMPTHLSHAFQPLPQGMKSADYSGKKQTDLFPCQLATLKESKQCVVQEEEHPCESQGERQVGGSSTCSSTGMLSVAAGTAKPPLSRAVCFLAGPLEPEISQLT